MGTRVEALRRFLKNVILSVGTVLFLSGFYLYAYVPLSGLPFFLASDPLARLLLVADPQMEGDSRISKEGEFLGKLNLNINDYFNRHVYSSMMSSVRPTHVFVLGDLFSSQWISEFEHNERVKRYNWIFNHPRIDSGEVQLINITGNHDIGYANEVSNHHISIFERAFGPVNTKLYAAGHILGVFNSLNIDTSSDKNYHDSTWRHLKELASEVSAENSSMIILTHVPLWKPEGNCVDGPDVIRTPEGIVTQQNVISQDSTKWILENLKPKIILNGHDHYGCKYTHPQGTKE